MPKGMHSFSYFPLSPPSLSRLKEKKSPFPPPEKWGRNNSWRRAPPFPLFLFPPFFGKKIFPKRPCRSSVPFSFLLPSLPEKSQYRVWEKEVWRGRTRKSLKINERRRIAPGLGLLPFFLGWVCTFLDGGGGEKTFLESRPSILVGLSFGFGRRE